MANRYNRPIFSRARQRSMDRKRLIIIGGAVAALVLIVVLALTLPKGRPDRAAVKTVDGAMQAEGEPLVPQQAEGEPLVPLNTPTPTPEPAPEPTPQPEAADPQRALARPTATAEGFMPVFSKANTQEKIVAITVDDCFQAENLRQIVDKAIEVGGKLTIFPIGQNVVKQAQSEILKYAWENGFELENHTYTHNGLFACSNEELAQEVYSQQMALSHILGVEYQCHFLRPRGGDARGDQRMQMYAKQLGYYGIAHWSASGSANNTKIAKALEPGAIYLFHTTDTDLEKLLRFIPWVVEQGYQLVTLNEMFGYPANETRPLEGDAKDYPVPQLEPYQMVYVPLKKTTFSWEAYLLQEKLIAMGYLTGSPDGVYGDGCVAAIRAYQKDHGMEQTGEADADLVRTILESA
ncbi:MAG: polysaccharide deacetylase family protein [Clostridia bacterium]|nr:polysaccharide deacetylase family protein [Clostridia bacterium]